MKKIIGEIKLQILSGKANPAPPIGPALGQKGVNINEFCRQFNEKTKGESKDIKIPVVITVFSDRTFSFITKSPPVSDLIKQYIQSNKGSATPGREIVANVKKSDMLTIAKVKYNDMAATSIEKALKMVKGTARSMGVSVSD